MVALQTSAPARPTCRSWTCAAPRPFSGSQASRRPVARSCAPNDDAPAPLTGLSKRELLALLPAAAVLLAQAPAAQAKPGAGARSARSLAAHRLSR
jgi:hypothetical protein